MSSNVRSSRRRWLPSRLGSSVLVTALLLAAAGQVTVLAGSASAGTETGTVTAGGASYRNHPLTVPGRSLVTVDLTWTGDGNLDLFLKAPDGSTVDSSVTGGTAEALVYVTPGAGSYAVGVKATSGSGTYTLTTDVTPFQDPGGRSTFSGAIAKPGVSARHDFTVDGPGLVVATLDWTTGSTNLNLFLRDASSSQLTKAAFAVRPEILAYEVPAAGRYSLIVSSVSGATDYTLTVEHPPGPTPTQLSYERTVSGPGHAAMYPSGLDVGPDQTVYIADTGNDQVAAIRPDGSRIWTVGVRGPKTLGEFVDPRDVAYLDGLLYVGDTGNSRVVVLDAATGAGISEWPGLGSILGVTAGRTAAGVPVVLVTQDAAATVRVMLPDGTLLRSVGSGPGSGLGKLRQPRDAATDSAGNIYVADYGNDRIAKFDGTGNPLPGWGSRGSAHGQLDRPYGVAVSEADVVYVADSNNNRIEAFSTAGVWLQSVDGSTSGDPLVQLRRVALGPGAQPDVYGADLWAYRVERFTSAGTYLSTYGVEGPPEGLLNEPSGLDIDSEGRLFVMDTVNQRVQRFSPRDVFQDAFGSRGWGADLSGFAWARDLAVDPATGNVWVADTKNSRLTEFTAGGTPTERVITGVYWPQGLTVLDGTLIVADTGNNRVQRIDPGTGAVLWSVKAAKAPMDVVVANGEVYATDSGNKRVVVLDAASGAELRSFGTADLHLPTGIVVRDNGNVIVADTSWNRLVEFSPTGSRLGLVGSYGTGHGQFNYPSKLVISGGQLYVADQWNDRIEVYGMTP